MAGQLAGIAIRACSRGEIILLDQAAISSASGVDGDFRGALAQRKGRPGYAVTLIEAESWAAAMAELGADEPWWKRRVNLLLEGIRLPRAPGTLLRLGEQCVLQVSMECDPCSRMEEVMPGLKAALRPYWRGGVRARALEPGTVRIGDEVRIET